MIEIALNKQAYAKAIVMQDPSRICDLYHSSWQYGILNPLSEAMDQTCNLMVPSQIRSRCATTGTPVVMILTFLLPNESQEPEGDSDTGIFWENSYGTK